MENLITAIIVDNEPDVKVIDKAENAQVALEAVIDKHPDLLFLDIQMPVYDGF